MFRETVTNTKKEQKIDAIVQILRTIQSSELVSNNSIIYDEFSGIIQRLKEKSFRVVVAGEFSSGKSTFLNAIIGRDLLKHGVQETTATVTEIYNEISCTDTPVLDVYFSDGTVQKGIQASQIMEVTATSSSTHAVAQEIDKVVIRYKILDHAADVCFIDTPGLNGMADKHREKTIEQIKNAHACIYLMQVRGLSSSDIEFLEFICRYQHNVIFVQNFIDELKQLEGETPEEKIAEQKKYIEEKIAQRVENLKYKIVGISARKALIARASEFHTYDNEPLTAEIRNRLYKESQFEQVMGAIRDLMEENEKNKIQQRDAVQTALELLEQLKQVVTFEKDQRKAKWENSAEGIIMQNYEKLLEFLKENKAVYQKKLENYIESEIYGGRRECIKNIKNALEMIEKDVENQIFQIKEIEQAEKYISEKFSGIMYSKISSAEEKLNQKMKIKFKNLVCDAALKIEQYTGRGETKLNIPFFSSKIISESEMRNFTEDENEINALRNKLHEKQAKNDQDEINVKELYRKKEEFNIILREKQKEISSNKERMQLEIAKLGAKPEPEMKMRQIVKERQGGILKKILRPKEEIEEVPFYDDTKQIVWEVQKENIEEKFHEEERRINEKIILFKEGIRRCEQEISHYNATKSERIRELESMRQLFHMKEEELQVQKREAKQEYLKYIQDRAIKRSKDYLFREVEGTLIHNFDKMISDNKKEIYKKVISLFDTSYKERIGQLEKILGGQNPEDIYKEADKLIRNIDQANEKMEEFLCQQ